LANVANEALMAPVRKCLAASYFKEVLVESSGSQQQQGFRSFLWSLIGFPNRQAMLMPCSQFDPFAIRMNMLDPSFPTERLLVPPVTSADLTAALRKLKPSVDKASLKAYADFANSFGDKGAVQGFEDDEAGFEADDDEQQQQQQQQTPPTPPRPAQQSHSSRALVPG
jgi:hypothetical protein